LQDLTLNYPDRVGKLILYAIGCGGEGSAPQSQDVRNEFINGTGTAEDRIARLVPLFFPKNGAMKIQIILKIFQKLQRQFLVKHLTSR
jgi:hypothetical protein